MPTKNLTDWAMSERLGSEMQFEKSRQRPLAIIALLASFLTLIAASASPNPSAVNGFLDSTWENASKVGNYEPKKYPGSLYWIGQEMVGAGEMWNDGWTGEGVDVAVIDTGVVPVAGLSGTGKVVFGPDLSFESQSPTQIHLDTNGHGTHMAGIIAGRDGTSKVQKGTEKEFLGIAPGARIVSVKVGNFEGAVDVSQVIAAIDWVVENKNANGLNIRVLNLSFGTLSNQPYLVDPLAHAVERAWKAGIVVVVAAGNDGSSAMVRNPATSPFVIAVGASVPNSSYSAHDDKLAVFSNCGGRGVDVVAPGKSVVSLLAPGSKIATDHPESVVEGRFLLGSGTSQAAAVVSGAAALIIDQRPGITPDQLKKLLKSTAQSIPGVSTGCQGSGLIDLKKARDTATPSALASKQTFTASTGTGSLDLARGNVRVSLEGVDLIGEVDIFGNPYNSAAHAVLGTTWSGGQWNGTTWSGTTWSGNAWTGTTWSGTTWSGITWSGITWPANSWAGTTWSGTTWSGTTWSAWGWSSTGWLGRTWG